MNKLVKSLFIAILAFSVNLSFAGGEKEIEKSLAILNQKLSVSEEIELRAELLKPIIDNFTDSSSLTKLMSNKIIEAQKNAKKSFTIDEIGELVKTIKADPEFNDKYKDVINDAITCKNDRFATKYVKSWQFKMANCREYVDLVLTAFNFNIMNSKARGETQRFDLAIYVKTIGDTGDHGFVLVEGKSGYVFAVDPWMRKVTKLENFNNLLTDMLFENTLTMPKVYSNMLNQLFKTTDDKGNTYYDELYVSKDTQWSLDIEHTRTLYRITHTWDDYTQAFYDDENIKSYFRGWTMDYNQLMKSTVTVKK